MICPGRLIRWLPDYRQNAQNDCVPKDEANDAGRQQASNELIVNAPRRTQNQQIVLQVAFCFRSTIEPVGGFRAGVATC
jgi:hypothetical protein